MSSSRLGEQVRVHAFLADAVDCVDGRLAVLGGGWNRITVGSVPTVVARIGLAIIASVPATAAGTEHHLAVHLEDGLGTRLPLASAAGDPARPVVSLEGIFTAEGPSPNAPDLEQLVVVALTLEQVAFARPGTHRFVVAVDGCDVGVVPFLVEVSAGTR